MGRYDYYYCKYGVTEGRLPYEGGTPGIDGWAYWDLEETEDYVTKKSLPL